jgi:hypothetical protein
MKRKAWMLLLAFALCGYIAIDLLMVYALVTHSFADYEAWAILIIASFAAWRCLSALRKRSSELRGDAAEYEVPARNIAASDGEIPDGKIPDRRDPKS